MLQINKLCYNSLMQWWTMRVQSLVLYLKPLLLIFREETLANPRIPQFHFPPTMSIKIKSFPLREETFHGFPRKIKQNPPFPGKPMQSIKYRREFPTGARLHDILFNISPHPWGRSSSGCLLPRGLDCSLERSSNFVHPIGDGCRWWLLRETWLSVCWTIEIDAQYVINISPTNFNLRTNFFRDREENGILN